MSRWIFAALLLALTGCATKPPAAGAALPVPAARIAWANAADGYSIRVTRDIGYSGSACATRIYIDGRSAADIEPGETVVFVVTPGRHILGASPSPAEGKLCTAGGSVERMRREVDASGEKGDSLSFRFGKGANGEPSITPTAF